MKIIITEPTEKDNTKSVGCYFIESIVKKNGYQIEYIDFDNLKYRDDIDLYLFSVHHVKDIFYLNRKLKYKKDKIWIGGGHVMNNPYPFLHFFDLICIGEGEKWIISILKLYENIKNKKEFLKESIKIEGSLTEENKENYIRKQYINDISINNIYLNKSFSKGHSDTWYIEIARGCKSKCMYCELGWSVPYRENNREKILGCLDTIKESYIKKVNIFAPDDFSVSFYNDCIEKILENKMITNFGSMRIQHLEEMKIKVKKNFLFRFGIDGLSERIRKIINKKVSNDYIIEKFSELVFKGFVMFKFFMIFSYPFEESEDFEEFKWLINQLKIKLRSLKRPIFLRIKFTPFIPNYLTPMENFIPFYNKKMREKIEVFFLQAKMNRSNIVVINDGILEPYSYYTQTFLCRCNYEDIDLDLLQNRKVFNFLSEQKIKEIKYNNKIVTNIDRKKRNEIFEKRFKKYEL